MQHASLSEFPQHGTVKPGFERLAQAFKENFTNDIDVGAGFCVYQGDETLVDLWGGYTDKNCMEAWKENTLVNVYSTSKGMASLVVAMAVEAGLLDYDAPVAKYWPELKAGQNGLTVGQLLSHQGGLCGLETPLLVTDLYDWEQMVSRLEAQEPLWKPGTLAGYHAITWGYLAGELVSRTLGTRLADIAALDKALTLGQLFADKVALPINADVYIGLPEKEMSRVANMISPKQARQVPGLKADNSASIELSYWYKLSLMNPLIGPYRDVSTSDWQRAEIPAANGHANAKGIARVYAALANGGEFRGVRIIGADVILEATREEVGAVKDAVLQRPVRRGRGFILNTESAYGPNDSAFGHSGAGGSLGFADPVNNIGFAYVMNQMQGETGTNEITRAGRLVTALYSCL